MGAETINLSSLRIEPAIFGRVIIPLKVEGREAGAAAGFLKDGLTARRALDTLERVRDQNQILGTA